MIDRAAEESGISPAGDSRDRLIVKFDPGGPVELTGLSDSFAALAHNRREITEACQTFMSGVWKGSHAMSELGQCPLLGVKQTWLGHAEMSAYDPKRKFGPADCCHAKWSWTSIRWS